MDRVGELLGALPGKSPLRRRLSEARALEKWPELVGPHLAKLTRPLRLAGGRLFVVAHGAALRQELSFQRVEILGRFNRAAGAHVARELVLLESDANLSSLVEAAEATAAAEQHAVADPGPAPPGDGPPAPGAARDDDDETGEDDESTARTETRPPVVPPFDAAAYRDEMARIAREPAGRQPRERT